MTAPVAWWPELRAVFALSVTPAMQMSSISEHISASATLGVTPSIDMAANMRGAASFGLTLTPQFAMVVPLTTPASFGVGVTPQVGVSGAERYARAFTFGVTPAVGATGALRRVGSFELSVTPAIGITGTLRISDDFNRANGAPGANWTLTPAAGLAILGNQLAAAGVGAAKVGAWAVSMPTDNYRVGVTIGAVIPDAGIFLFVRSNNTNNVAANVTAAGTAQIFTNNGAYDTIFSGTSQVSSSGAALATGQQWTFEATSANAYILKLGGVTQLTWTDTGGAVWGANTNSAHRQAAVGIFTTTANAAVDDFFAIPI